MSWLQLNRWWLAAIPLAAAALVAASGYNAKVWWYDDGLHHRIAASEPGAFVDVSDRYTDSLGETSRSLRVRWSASGEAQTFPAEDGNRLPGPGMSARFVRLDFEADPGETLNYCFVTVEDDQGRRYDVPDQLEQATPCLPAGHGGPVLPVGSGQQRGEVPEGEDRPATWSVAPIFVLPEDAEIRRVLVWWDLPEFVELPPP